LLNVNSNDQAYAIVLLSLNSIDDACHRAKTYSKLTTYDFSVALLLAGFWLADLSVVLCDYIVTQQKMQNPVHVSIKYLASLLTMPLK